MRKLCLLLSLLIPLSFAPSPAQADEGKRIENFELRDYHGKLRSLDELARDKAVVVVFLGNDCPLAKLYAPRLQSLSREFKDRDVVFVGINSNLQDVPTRIAAFARIHGLEIPILKDPGNKIADVFEAVRTPEVFLLDKEREVRYRGRIDDQYVVGAQKPAIGRRDLALAIEELLAGKPVSQTSTDAVGCFIGRVRKTPPRGDITFSRHIAPIFNQHCVECHREGELGPFPLTSYGEVEGWAETIREVVSDGRMPPWFADPKHGKFANDISLTDEEKQLLYAWVENGAPQGDAKDLPEAPKFEKGWRIGKPDAVFHLPKAFDVKAEGTIAYKYFLIEPDLKDDLWVTKAEARPGNPAVVHHIVMYSVPRKYKDHLAAMLAQQNEPAADSGEAGARRQRQDPGNVAGAFGQMVAIYAPGMPPWRYPEGTAMKIPQDSFFLVQMHYTPNGTEQQDRSYVGFEATEPAKVKRRIRYGMAVNTDFRIPPHADNHRAVAEMTIPSDALLLNLFPHMHYRGKAFRIEAVYPDGAQEVLLDVPRYDFNWQLRYDLTQPKSLPKGTKLVCTAHFDNSAGNLLNPDPSRAVGFGLQSWQEMLVGYFTMVPADEDLQQPQKSDGDE